MEISTADIRHTFAIIIRIRRFSRSACGPNVDDYEWTEGVMKTCFRHCPENMHGFMDGLSLHYYTHPEGWQIKGSATDFDDKVWYKTLAKDALYGNAR